MILRIVTQIHTYLEGNKLLIQIISWWYDYTMGDFYFLSYASVSAKFSIANMNYFDNTKLFENYILSNMLRQ